MLDVFDMEEIQESTNTSFFPPSWLVEFTEESVYSTLRHLDYGSAVFC